MRDLLTAELVVLEDEGGGQDLTESHPKGTDTEHEAGGRDHARQAEPGHRDPCNHCIVGGLEDGENDLPARAK